MKKRLLSVLLLLALALSLLPTTAQAIIRGDSFRLKPQSGATRASACAMLHRFFAT